MASESSKSFVIQRHTRQLVIAGLMVAGSMLACDQPAAGPREEPIMPSPAPAEPVTLAATAKTDVSWAAQPSGSVDASLADPASGPVFDDNKWECSGLAGANLPTPGSPTDFFYTTGFGCWTNAKGKNRNDSGDNCVPQCAPATIGCTTQDGACERSIKWFTAGADRWPCGTKLLVRNQEYPQMAVVVMVIDRGPNCKVEKTVKHWVMDLSYPALRYLFTLKESQSLSAKEKAAVTVEVVDAASVLGPVTAAADCEKK